MINRVPWDAVDACMRGAAFGPDKRSWSRLQAEGIATWQVGVVRDGARPEGEYEQGAKGVDGGAVRLVGTYADAGAPANGAS